MVTCKQAMPHGTVWYFVLQGKILDRGWFITGNETEGVYCGEVSYRSDEAKRLCEDCCRRNGYIW